MIGNAADDAERGRRQRPALPRCEFRPQPDQRPLQAPVDQFDLLGQSPLVVPAQMYVARMVSVLAEYVSGQFSRQAHFVFDGVARYDLQARMFDELMVFFDRPDYTIIVLELSLEAAKKRLARRARSDEATAEQTRNRFRWWAEKTIPAIAMLEKMGRKVHRLDGSLPVEQVHKTIAQRLDLCG